MVARLAPSSLRFASHAFSHSRQVPLPGYYRSFSATSLARAANAWNQSLPVTYKQLKPITEQPDGSILILDVREKEEQEQGMIPSAVPLPLSQFSKALDLNPGEFTRIHGYDKPGFDQKIITYCRTGKRSQTALETLKAKHFHLVRNYEGSYVDWLDKEKSSSSSSDDSSF